MLPYHPLWLAPFVLPKRQLLPTVFLWRVGWYPNWEQAICGFDLWWDVRGSGCEHADFHWCHHPSLHWTFERRHCKGPKQVQNANSKDVASNFKQLQQKAVPSFRPTYTWPHGLNFTDGNSDKESYESYGPLSQPFAPWAMDMKTGRSTEVYDLNIVVTPI